MLKSQKVLGGLENADIRNVAKAMGYSDDDLSNGRPVIGIANSWNTFIPGHFHFNQISRQVQKGIHRAGGTAFEFGVIGLCDALSKHDFNYVLPSREVICDSLEVMAGASPLDGLVLLASCDKIVPGMLMAAARLNIPAVLVPGGPMQGGLEYSGGPSDSTRISEAVGSHSAGGVTLEKLKDIEDLSCPGCGSCSFMGTANTMCCLAEAMGMTLPDGAAIPAVHADRLRLAEKSGEVICQMVRSGLKTRDIINPHSLENAVKVCMATGGSTNAVLHLTALAYEAEAPIDILSAFEQYRSTTPAVARVYPAGPADMEAFWKAGSIPRVIAALAPLLHMDALTCNGRTLRQNIDSFRFRFPPNPNVIRDLNNPFDPEGGIAVIRGNLAPNTGISKPAAVDPSVRRFSGRAMVFDAEEDANKAILDGRVTAGTVVVIRYEGPKGGPGMVEMYRAMKYLHGLGLHKSTAVITDGRFSGTNNGCFVGHISPEASEGGPIALVNDGDLISIDLPAGSIHLNVPDSELRQRLKEWKKPAPKVTRGYLALYSQLASSAAEGAIIRPPA